MKQTANRTSDQGMLSAWYWQDELKATRNRNTRQQCLQ